MRQSLCSCFQITMNCGRPIECGATVRCHSRCRHPPLPVGLARELRPRARATAPRREGGTTSLKTWRRLHLMVRPHRPTCCPGLAVAGASDSNVPFPAVWYAVPMFVPRQIPGTVGPSVAAGVVSHSSTPSNKTQSTTSIFPGRVLCTRLSYRGYFERWVRCTLTA